MNVLKIFFGFGKMSETKSDDENQVIDVYNLTLLLFETEYL